MNRGLEFEGKNVKLAIEKACNELNLSQDNIKYDVISNGSSGIFGLVGVKKARIRVFIQDVENKNANGRNAFSDDASFDYGVKSLVDEAFNGHQKTSPKKSSTKPVNNRSGGSSSRLTKISRRPDTKPDKIETETETETKTTPAEDNQAAETTVKSVSEETLKLGVEALQKILDLITTDATITVEQDADRILFNVVGGNSGVLIGKRGQNLEAIQYIIDKIINKHNEKRVRVNVDVEGYLESRKSNLVKLAEKLAEKTKKTGKPSTIGQMNAQDRRTVHIALKNHKGVRTQSIGNGYYRKLVIFPKKNNHRKKKQTETVSAE